MCLKRSTRRDRTMAAQSTPVGTVMLSFGGMRGCSHSQLSQKEATPTETEPSAVDADVLPTEPVDPMGTTVDETTRAKRAASTAKPPPPLKKDKVKTAPRFPTSVRLWTFVHTSSLVLSRLLEPTPARTSEEWFTVPVFM